MIWPALAWLVMRFAVWTAAPKISRFSSTTGPKCPPMRIAIGCPSTFSSAVDADVVLHAAAGVERIVRGRERRHDLVADRLDHRAVVLLGGGAHDLHAGQHHVAGAQVAHDFVDARAADHIGEQDGEFDVFSHDLWRSSSLRLPPPIGILAVRLRFPAAPERRARVALYDNAT